MADEEVDFSVCAVLPAAGSGVRTGLETPKQFALVLGRPLISYTIEAFERVSWIQRIVVSVSKESQQDMEEVVRDFNHNKVKITVGGTTRHRSIFNGVKELALGDSQPPDVVIIHDAVRPFVNEDILKKVALAAKKHGASGAVRPLVSTVIAVNSEGLLDHSLERSKYRASEMPQAFRFDAIFGAYKKCTEYDFEFGTECLHLAQRYSGVQAMLVDGPDSLWKVTFKKDLFAAEAVLKDMTKLKAVVIGSLDSNIEKKIMLQLTSQNVEVSQSSWTEMKTLAAPSCNVIIAVNRQNDQLCSPSKAFGASSQKHSFDLFTQPYPTRVAVQDEKCKRPTLSSECLDCFSDEPLFQLLTLAIQKRTIVAVHLSNNKNDMDVVKEKVKMLNHKCRSSKIQCYGIFVDTSCCSQDNIPSRNCEEISTMIADVALNTSAVLSGQVFQYLW